MIKCENVEVFNFNNALRGLRNPKNSWERSDSRFGITDKKNITADLDIVAATFNDPIAAKEWLYKNGLNNEYITQNRDYSVYAFIGANDLKLAQTMVGSGTDDSKFMRQIFISVDITAPLYWWKEFDTYKVGTVSDSCSTMHKIQAKEFTLSDFSTEHLNDRSIAVVKEAITELNLNRDLFNEIHDKDWWWQMIQLLPSSYNQKRTITMNYQNGRAMHFARRYHKQDEWRIFDKQLLDLPYGKDLIGYEK